MKLLFKQRRFSWFDSYDIYCENGNKAYTVKGELSWGHQLRVYGANGEELGLLKERVISFLPKFEMYIGGQYIGCIKKEFTFFSQEFSVECNGWRVDGDWFGWDYTVSGAQGEHIATVTKELFNWTDTYVMDIQDPQNALSVLMLVLAIDAEKCSRNK